MFIKMPYIKRKLRSLSIKVFNFTENNGDCLFESNGEKSFVDNLFASFTQAREIIAFDIGANNGEYAQMLNEKAKKTGVDLKLHLFEPTRSCFKVISEKFAGNKSIILNNYGVSDEKASATIFYDAEESGLASLYQRNLKSYGLQLNQSETISLIRLDRYIEEENITHINFIKIDIEGHELKAFEGFGNYMSGDFVDYVQFEYGGANLDSRTSLMELYQFFTDRGFLVAKVMPKGLELRPYAPYMENFNYSNYVAISTKVV